MILGKAFGLIGNALKYGHVIYFLKNSVLAYVRVCLISFSKFHVNIPRQVFFEVCLQSHLPNFRSFQNVVQFTLLTYSLLR